MGREREREREGEREEEREGVREREGERGRKGERQRAQTGKLRIHSAESIDFSIVSTLLFPAPKHPVGRCAMSV